MSEENIVYNSTEDMRSSGRAHASPWLGTAFLSGGPASYGLLTDAFPIATRQVLITANGYATSIGVGVPMYTACDGGIAQLMQKVFPMLAPGGMCEEVLCLTFGDCQTSREHPVARFGAALTEAVATDYLTRGDQGDGYTDRPDQRLDKMGSAYNWEEAVRDTSRNMGEYLSGSLRQLRAHLTEQSQLGGAWRRLQTVDSVSFDVDFFACRVSASGSKGDYAIEIYAAGSFRLFLLDGDGLFPLWGRKTPRLSPDTEDVLAGHFLTVHHPTPFALLLLSDSVCTPFRIDTTGEGSMSVRDRLRLEERILRGILAASSEGELGARAAQSLADLASGGQSVSGSATILTGTDSNFTDFRTVCAGRLRRLEQDLALLPEAYDPSVRREEMTCLEYERRFVRDLFANRPDLLDRTMHVLEGLVKQRLSEIEQAGAGQTYPESDAAALSPPEESEDPIRHLTVGDVYRELRRFDAVNDRLRERIRESRRLMRRFMAEHWITLRPLLCAPGTPGYTETGAVIADTADRQYRCCMELNYRLDAILTMRRSCISAVRELLARSLAHLDGEGEDWALGRGDAAGCSALLQEIDHSIPPLLHIANEAWGTHDLQRAGNFTALQTAYIAEREKLFDQDTAGGVFTGIWSALLDGSLSDEAFQTLRAAVVAGAGQAFGAALDAVSMLSSEIRHLKEQIAYSGAERQCCRAIMENFDWQFVCLRGAVYSEYAPDWRAVTDGLVDGATVNAYRRVVREWQEARMLEERRRKICYAYREAWNRYLPDESACVAGI